MIMYFFRSKSRHVYSVVVKQKIFLFTNCTVFTKMYVSYKDLPISFVVPLLDF